MKWVPPVTAIIKFSPEINQSEKIYFRTALVSKSFEELDDNQKITVLQKEIQHLKDEIEQAEKRNAMFNPHISASPPQVHYVSVDSLHQLDEYREDATRWWSIATTFLGVLLGIMGNIATGATISTATWVIVLLAGAMGSFATWQAILYDRRAKKLSDKILTKPTAP